MCDPENIWPPQPPPGDYSEDVYRMFKQAYECTEDDAKLNFTTEQLKELCLKHKCQVIASRWNIAYEFRLWLRKEGRLVGKSETYERRMIAKGVNRHKDKMLYDENIIQQTRDTEWRFRKKDSILSLRLWEHQRKQKENQPEAEEGETREQEERQPETEEVESSCYIDMKAINNLEDNLTLLASSGELSNFTEVNIDNAACCSEFDNNELGVLPSTQGADKDLLNMFDVNTESMTVSQIDTQSLMPSQDIFSEDFGNEISCTSTQKQTVEIEIVNGN